MISDLFADLMSILFGIKERGLRPIQTTPIAFATKTTDIINKSFGKRSVRLYIVKVEGNLRTTDQTTITVNKFAKTFYGNFSYRLNMECDRLIVTPKYGDTRYGMCNITYAGDYFDAISVGTAQPLNVVSLIEEITKVLEVTLVKEISKILEVTLVKVIEKIELIEKIEEITTIRDLTHKPKEFIVNSSWEEDFVGWFVGYPSLFQIVTGHYVGTKACKIIHESYMHGINQTFPIPISTDWFEQLVFWQRVSIADTGVTVKWYYTDGTTASMWTKTQPSTQWTRQTITSPKNGKHVYRIEFVHLGDNNSDYTIDELYMVF